jgi:phage gp36-like protein
MAYTTIIPGKDDPLPWQDIKLFCSDAGDDEDVTDATLAARAQLLCDEAAAEIDGMLTGQGYSLPFNPVPKIIAIISKRKCTYLIYTRRRDVAVPESVVKDAEAADRMLRDIAARRIQLAESSGPVAGGAPLASKTESDQVWGSDMLGKLP